MATNRAAWVMGFIVLCIGLAMVLFTMMNFPNEQGDLTIKMYERAQKSYLAVWAWGTVTCFMGFGVMYVGRKN